MITKTLKQHSKNWLIAHKGNDHWPHLLRTRGVAIGIVLVLVVQLVFNFAITGQFKVLGYASNINSGDLLQLTNNERANHGLKTLNSSSQLNQAAHAKAQHMLNHNYWAHVAPDGTEPWYFINQSGYSYTHAGENLAKDFQTSSGVMAGWMNSGSHRQNILNSNYIDVGFAVVNGTLNGSQTTLVVALYAAPATPTPPPAPTQTAAAPAPDPAPTPPAPQPPTEAEEEETSPAPEETEPEETLAFAGLNLEPTDHQIAPAETAYGITRPLPLSDTLTMAEKSTAFILSGFLLANTMNHTIVWRKRGTRLKRAQHIWFRTHPAVQAAVLAVPIIVMLLSGLGTVL